MASENAAAHEAAEDATAERQCQLPACQLRPLGLSIVALPQDDNAAQPGAAVMLMLDACQAGRERAGVRWQRQSLSMPTLRCQPTWKEGWTVTLRRPCQLIAS